MQNLDTISQSVPKKQSKGASIFMGLLALAFSYIITKEMTVPPFLMMIGMLLGGVVLLLAGLNRPEIVTYVLVAYLPFSKILAGDFGGWAVAFNLTNLLMGFIFLVWMTGRFSADEPLWTSAPLNFPIFLFILLGCISVARGSYYGTGYLWPAVIEFKRWITPILIYFLVLNTVRDRATIKNIVIIMIIVTTLVGLMAIYDYIQVGESSSLDDARVGGIAGHSNTLAAFFNYYMFLPFGFFLMNFSRKKYWWLLVPFLICFRGIMVTFSRGGYLAFACGLYAISFFRNKGLFIFLLFVSVIAFFNPLLLPAGIRYRMAQTFERDISYVDTAEGVEDSLDVSAKSRVEIWKGGLKMVAEQPFFGVGYGLFEALIPYYWSGGSRIDAHNTYLIIAAEMGVPALLVFLLIIFLVIHHARSLYRATKDPFAKALALGFLGGLFGLLMSNMFGSRLDSQEVSGYFWILAALVMRLSILDRREREPEGTQRYAISWTS